MAKLIDIKFQGVDELAKLAEKQAQLLKQNVTNAVVDTTLFGISKIANDCPVDTGRLRASITGEFADDAEVDLKKGKSGEGKKLSATKIDRKNMQGRIGTNVEYALYVEYGHQTRGPNKRSIKLTDKQRKYLFANGILKDVGGKVVVWRRGRTAFIRRKVPGKGFFRKNIPVIEAHFDRKMNEAIDATKEGHSLGGLKGD